jgi:hypothetical protein
MKPRPVILSSSHSPSYLQSAEQEHPSQPGSGVARGKVFPRTGAWSKIFNEFVTGFVPRVACPPRSQARLTPIIPAPTFVVGREPSDKGNPQLLPTQQEIKASPPSGQKAVLKNQFSLWGGVGRPDLLPSAHILESRPFFGALLPCCCGTMPSMGSGRASSTSISRCFKKVLPACLF